MREPSSIIGKWEIFFITTILLFNERVLTVPRVYAEIAEQDSWIGLIMAGIIAFVFGWFFYSIVSKSQRENLIEFAKRLLGKTLGNLVAIIFGCYLILSIGFSLRIVADGVHSFLLDKTPTGVVVASFLLVIVYIVNCGLSTMIKFYCLAFPITVFGIILILLTPMKTYSWEQLLPILPEGFGRVLKNIPYFLTSFMNFALLGFIIPKSEEKKKLGLPILGAVLLVILLKAAILITLTAFFGAEELKHEMYPLLSMAKGIELKNLLFERVETLLTLAWIPITFNAISANYYMANAVVNNFVPKANRLISTMVLAGIVLFISLRPDSTAENMESSKMVELTGASLSYGMILVLFIIVKLRGIKGDGNQG